MIKHDPIWTISPENILSVECISHPLVHAEQILILGKFISNLLAQMDTVKFCINDFLILYMQIDFY